MKNERRIIMVIVLMIVLFVWGLVQCQEARADHWRATASLLPGTYKLTYNVPAQTAAILAMNETHASLLGFIAVGEALTIIIDKEYTSDMFVEFLNVEPKTYDYMLPTLFVKKVDFAEQTYWVQIKLPCKWTLGDVAM